MQVKATLKGLSIPPYLSTTWSNILSLSSTGNDLQVKLNDGSIVNIPNLEPDQMILIYEQHQKFLDTSAPTQERKAFRLDIGQVDETGKIGFLAFDELGTMMQHNPEQADLPDLPGQVIEKLRALAQTLPPMGLEQLPQAHLHCNCIHCQITRALTDGIANPEEPIEVTISDDELTFSEWDVTETGDKLFTVINKLDPTEEYHVFLGQPIGCTCGNNKCEHILAALKS